MNMKAALEHIDKKKAKLDLLRPLPPELIQNLQEWFAIDLTYNSNAIEGNSLTASETAVVVEKGLTIGGKTVKEHLEAINHIHALDYIKELAQKKEVITVEVIKNIHLLILKSVDDSNAGRWRKVAVKISGSDVQLPEHFKIQGLMEQFDFWLKNATTMHPVEKAIKAHFDLVAIRPFVDGNGRVARLLMNFILLQAGYPSAVIKQEKRATYIASLEHAHATSDLSKFKKFVCKAIDDSLSIWIDSAVSSNIKA